MLVKKKIHGQKGECTLALYETFLEFVKMSILLTCDLFGAFGQRVVRRGSQGLKVSNYTTDERLVACLPLTCRVRSSNSLTIKLLTSFSISSQVLLRVGHR